MSSLFQLLGWENHLRYDRDLVAQGRYFLLYSAQLVHLNWSHWMMNMAGLVMTALLFGHRASFWQWLLVFAVSASAVGLGLWWFDPELRWYVGLSGALHGLLVAGAIFELRHHRLSGGLLLVLLAGKVLWEQLAGPMPGSESFIDGHVVVNSHFYGAVGGAVAALGLFVWTRFRPR